METSHHLASAPEFNVAMRSFHFICRKSAEVKENKQTKKPSRNKNMIWTYFMNKIISYKYSLIWRFVKILVPQEC